MNFKEVLGVGSKDGANRNEGDNGILVASNDEAVHDLFVEVVET